MKKLDDESANLEVMPDIVAEVLNALTILKKEDVFLEQEVKPNIVAEEDNVI